MRPDGWRWAPLLVVLLLSGCLGPRHQDDRCGPEGWSLLWSEPGAFQNLTSNGTRADFRVWTVPPEPSIPFHPLALDRRFAGQNYSLQSVEWPRSAFTVSTEDRRPSLILYRDGSVHAAAAVHLANETIRAAFRWFAENVTGADATRIEGWADQFMASRTSGSTMGHVEHPGVNVHSVGASWEFDVNLTGPWRADTLFGRLLPKTYQSDLYGYPGSQAYTAEPWSFHVDLVRKFATNGTNDENQRLSPKAVRIALDPRDRVQFEFVGGPSPQVDAVRPLVESAFARLGLPRPTLSDAEVAPTGACYPGETPLVP